MTKPKVVCFCGSTRFTSEMLVIQWDYAKRGIIVHTWHALPYGYTDEREAHLAEKEGVKEILDELHKRKIDLSDEVFVININGYIGESTRSEIEYAEKNGQTCKIFRAAMKPRKRINSSGKKGRRNIDVNTELWARFNRLGLPNYCELAYNHWHYPNGRKVCTGSLNVHWAHSKRRDRWNEGDGLLAVRACDPCHKFAQDFGNDENERIILETLERRGFVESV